MAVTPSITPQYEDLQLNFDDLLDIAREFEFTRAITHIWPCEERPTSPETGLEDILAAIMPTPNPEESFLPRPSSVLSMVLNPTHAPEVDLHRSPPTCPVTDASASLFRDVTPLSKDDHPVQVQVELPIRGWSPPNGSQFIDLDDSLTLPQSPADVWIPPWLATFLAPSCTQFASGTSQSPAAVPTIGDIQPQTTGARNQPVSTSGRAADDPKESQPFVSLPVQPSTCDILEPVRARSALRTDSNIPVQTTTIPCARTPRPRLQPPSIPATGGAFVARYAKAPRGGIPPHIARTVTKANSLRAEKERNVMRDAFLNTTTGEGKKPSVLCGAAKVERETGKIAYGDGKGKKLFALGENDENEGRVVKRARVL